ncbi:MAG: T9SS type A sorting domain-containing protein, partial [Bacteroidetes bacterium]|nr:T9SS type A sorting domain-containing protein [Bacteroidota bacterium]
MYFTAAATATSPVQPYLIGKIEANGNMSWMKSTTSIPVSVATSTINTASLTPGNMFLDSGNNLLVAGNISGPGHTALIKLDTAGNFIKARTYYIYDFDSSTGGSINFSYVLNEQQGITFLVTTGYLSGGASGFLKIICYSNSGDSTAFSTGGNLGGAINASSTKRYTFFKSKVRPDVFFLFGEHDISQPSPSAVPYRFVLGRYTFNSLQWTKAYRWTGALGSGASGLDEDEKGNIFGVVNTLNSTSSHNSGFVKFDSTGASNGNWVKYFNNYNPNTQYYPNDRVNVVHYNRYFMNVAGNGYPLNPLTIQSISPALTMSCANTVTLMPETSPLSQVGTTLRPPQYTITAMTMVNITPTITSVTNFSVANNFCATVNVPENELMGLESVSVYPNPTPGIITVSTNERSANIELYNVNGALVYSVKCMNNKQEIDLSKFQNGIYFLRCGTSVKKIVKE